MSLSNIARSKLSLSDSSNLHRWVLLKNSLVASRDHEPTPPTQPAAFMFPTYYSYPDELQDPNSRPSEALWLDTLLESLAHDEEDDAEDPPPIEEEEDDDDDDEEDDEADILSPMSSSDDLSQHTFMRYYHPPSPPRPQPPELPPLPLALPFPFSNLDVLDDDSIDDDAYTDSDPLKCSSCSSSTSSTSPSSSASSLPPSTPPSSPLRSWASVPKIPLPPLPSTTITTPPKPHIYIDAYSDPLPFSYDIHSPYMLPPP